MRRLILLRLIDSYFRHRWLYLLPVVMMIVAGVYYFMTQERLYISQGVVFVQKESYLASLTSVRSEGFSWNTPAQDTASEISDLIHTDAFIRAVIRETDLEKKMSMGSAVVDETIQETRKKIWAASTGKNQVSVGASDPDPRVAQQLALATIDNYTRWKINGDQTESGVAGEFFGTLIEQYKAEVEQARDGLRKYLTEHPEPVRGSRPEIEQMEIDHLQAVLQVAGTRLANAMEKEENARLATSQVETDVRQTYSLIDAPDVPEKPATSRRELAMRAAIFVVVGAILSVVGIAGSALLDRSLRFPGDADERLHLPLLTVVLDIRQRKKWYQKVLLRKKAKPVAPAETTHPDIPQREQSYQKALPLEEAQPVVPIETMQPDIRERKKSYRKALPKKKAKPVAPAETTPVREEAQDAGPWIDAPQSKEAHDLELVEPEASIDVVE